MIFEQAFKLSALLLAATALAGLLFARSVPAWLGVGTSTVLLLTLLQSAVGWRLLNLRPSQTIWNGLLIGSFLFFVIDITALSRELLPASIHFLVILLGIKVLTLNERRDYGQLYAICLMALLASAALTTDVWYVTIFILYLFAAVWTLLLYHLTGRTAASSVTPDGFFSNPPPPSRITRRFFWMTNGVVLFTGTLTLVVFFLLPRITVGMLQHSRGEGLRTTGFSERVDLGMIGTVKEDPQIVMRVELPDQPAGGKERLYLRGVAYDHYNGRSWSSGARYRRNLGLISDGTFVVRSGRSQNTSNLSEPLHQDILLEDLDTSVLFAAPFAEYVSGEFAGVQADGMTDLYLPYPSSSRIRYSVVSRERRILAEEAVARTLEYADSIRHRYLQLPEESRPIAELARRLTDRANTPSEKTTTILHHLLTNYQYSLEADTTTSAHPIEDFLFTRKTGYCEHYATAMVMMLRTLGIPARLVTGFLATEWNDFGNYYTVRQRDAHAWVEVYYPQSGWITVDPTPATSALPSPSMWDAFYRLGESFRLHWDRVIIRYSSRDQLAVVQSLREGSDSARDALSRWTAVLVDATSRLTHEFKERVRSLNPLLLWLFPLLPGIGLVYVVLLLKDRWRYRGASERPTARNQQQIVQLYKKVLEMAARRGIHTSRSMTPTELTHQVSQHWAEAMPAVAELIALYCRGRFSVSPLSAQEVNHALAQMSTLQRLTRLTR